jgi:hypothetical protein
MNKVRKREGKRRGDEMRWVNRKVEKRASNRTVYRKS